LTTANQGINKQIDTNEEKIVNIKKDIASNESKLRGIDRNINELNKKIGAITATISLEENLSEDAKKQYKEDANNLSEQVKDLRKTQKLLDEANRDLDDQTVDLHGKNNRLDEQQTENNGKIDSINKELEAFESEKSDDILKRGEKLVDKLGADYLAKREKLNETEILRQINEKKAILENINESISHIESTYRDRFEKHADAAIKRIEASMGKKVKLPEHKKAAMRQELINRLENSLTEGNLKNSKEKYGKMLKIMGTNGRALSAGFDSINTLCLAIAPINAVLSYENMQEAAFKKLVLENKAYAAKQATKIKSWADYAPEGGATKILKTKAAGGVAKETGTKVAKETGTKVTEEIAKNTGEEAIKKITYDKLLTNSTRGQKTIWGTLQQMAEQSGTTDINYPLQQEMLKITDKIKNIKNIGIDNLNTPQVFDNLKPVQLKKIFNNQEVKKLLQKSGSNSIKKIAELMLKK